MKRTRSDAALTRCRILEAASRVFSEKGFASSGLEDVAHEAGVTRGAIYWHFDGKHALLDALLASVTLPLDEVTPRDCLDQDCRALADALWETVSDQRFRRVVLILWNCSLSGSAPTQVRGRVERSRARLGEYLRRVVQLAIERGELRETSTGVRAECVLAGLTGLAFEVLRLTPPSDTRRILVVIRRLFGIGPQVPAA